MASIDKLLEKFYRKPIPNDITYDELRRIADHFGLIVKPPKGKHPMKISYPGIASIPIPVHKKSVGEAYIYQVKMLIEKVKEQKGE